MARLWYYVAPLVLVRARLLDFLDEFDQHALIQRTVALYSRRFRQTKVGHCLLWFVLTALLGSPVLRSTGLVCGSSVLLCGSLGVSQRTFALFSR